MRLLSFVLFITPNPLFRLGAKGNGWRPGVDMTGAHTWRDIRDNELPIGLYRVDIWDTQPDGDWYQARRSGNVVDVGPAAFIWHGPQVPSYQDLFASITHIRKCP